MSKKSTYLKALIILLVIIFVILIFIILNIKKENKTSTEKEKNNVNSATNNTKNNIEEFNEEFDIFNDTEQQAEVPYSDEQLDNFEFEIKNIPDEILEKIPNKDNFDKEIKKFIYLKGLVKATEANYYDSALAEDLESNKIAIRFSLNNVEKNLLLIVLNMKTGELEISNMKYDF